jgi:hypothetical protein
VVCRGDNFSSEWNLLTIIVPSNDLKEARAKSQDLIPALKPEQVGWEDSILEVGGLEARMWREPDGD